MLVAGLEVSRGEFIVNTAKLHGGRGGGWLRIGRGRGVSASAGSSSELVAVLAGALRGLLWIRERSNQNQILGRVSAQAIAKGKTK